MIKNKKQRVFVLIVMLLSLSACSSKIIYNNLDWHRQSELRSYITQLKVIQTDINKGVKQSDIADYMQAFKGFW